MHLLVKRNFTFLTLRCTKLNPLRSWLIYITIKYTTLNIRDKADGGGDFHYSDNVTDRSLCLIIM